jgi:DNA-binding SARP family transcriptional activator/tetratricopeptide (TPR) repeat protein
MAAPGLRAAGRREQAGVGGHAMLEISLLGEQRVALDGSVVDLGSPRAKALLGFLLLHRDVPQRREYVAAQFWPDSTTGQARTNLRRELHTLRTGLPAVAGWLAADRGTLLWRSGPGCQLDVADFEAAAGTAAAARTAGDDTGFRQAAAGAVRGYRGELLPALYDDWVATERDRLHRMCLLLLDQLIAADRAAGSYQDAIERARQRIDLEPLEEVGYRTLLQVQALAGDRAAALQTYHRCVSVLERELGVAPDRATIAEYERLAGPGPAGVAVQDADGPGAGAPGPEQAQRPAISPVRLVGREQEFQLLHRRWRETLTGTAGLVVLSGEAGVGKTRLLDELSAAVRRAGFPAPRARCFAARGRLALAPVSEWLRSPPLHAARAGLEPVWAREVDRLVPPLDARPAAPLRPMADAWQRHRFFEGLARAVLSAARPTLLVLDDLQWCDEDTLAWLQLLLHLGQDQPLLVLAATRRDEVAANAELSEMLRVLRSAGQLTEISVAPLDPARSRQLAGQVLGRGLATAEAELLQATTGGYPLFVIEAVRAGLLDRPGSVVPAPGPGGRAPEVRSVLAGRIRQAAPAARATAELAAVIGRDFTLELLAEASDLDSDAVMAAVDELWRRRIIREHAPARYDFCHDLLRDTSYDEVSPARRRLLHRRVAQALQVMHGDDPAAAAAIAYHYERADRPAQALPHHVRAAEVASQVFANQKAIRHYRRAAALLRHVPAGHRRDSTELAIRNAMAAPLNARYGYACPELQDVLERAGELAGQLGDSDTQLRSLVGLFSVRFVRGDITESHDIARRALALSERHPDAAGQAHWAVAGSATSLGRHEASLPHFELAHELCADQPPALVGTRLEVHARAWSAHPLWLLGREAEAVRWSDWAITRASEMDHPFSLALALSYAAITHQLRGDVPRTQQLARQVQEICARYDFAYYGNWGLILSGWCLGGADGAGQIRAGLARLRDQGALARHPYYQGLLAETLLRSGQGDAADVVLAAARTAAAVHEDRWWLPELYRLAARRAPGPAGTELLRRALDLAWQQGSRVLATRAAGDLAERRGSGGTERERSPNGALPTLLPMPGRSDGLPDGGGSHDHDSTAGPVRHAPGRDARAGDPAG